MNTPLRQPPHSIEAELSVIGGVMLENQAYYAAVTAKLAAADFWMESHQIIWGEISRMVEAGSPCDFVTLCNELRAKDLLERAGGMSYVGGIVNDTPGSSNVGTYAAMVRDKAVLRNVIGFGLDLAESSYKAAGSDEIVARAGELLAKLLTQQNVVSSQFATCVDAMREQVLYARDRRQAHGQAGIPTGIEPLDKLTGGLHGPRLVVVAGRPGAGKSAFVNQMAVNAAERGYPGLFCSIEMNTPELMMRLAALKSGINLSAIMRGHNQADDAIEAMESIGQLPLWFDDATSSLDQLCATITLHRQRHKIEWAVIDHIGLIKTERFSSRNDQMGHVSWTLKQLAKRVGIPVIALSQLSRLSERETRRPRSDDLRDSGNIEQDADIIMMLHTPQDRRGEMDRPVEIGITKNRCGPALWLDEKFTFCGKTQRFTQLQEDQPQNHW